MSQQNALEVEPGSRYLPLKALEAPPEAAAVFQLLVDELQQQILDPTADRNRVCREFLFRIFEGSEYGSYEEALKDARDPVRKARLLSLDPANVSLEPEYYAEIDTARYVTRKPLIWLWRQFDRSPMGENCQLGFALRRCLAKHVFRYCGENARIFPGLEIAFGYKLIVGDNVTIHRDVHIDDRGGVVIGNEVSLSDGVHIFSHQHCVTDARIVTTVPTIIEDGVRITYHATVLAGTRLGHDSLVGAMGVLTRDTRPHAIHVGIPAKKIKEKRAQCGFCKHRHDLECFLESEKEPV